MVSLLDLAWFGGALPQRRGKFRITAEAFLGYRTRKVCYVAIMRQEGPPRIGGRSKGVLAETAADVLHMHVHMRAPMPLFTGYASPRADTRPKEATL